MTATAVQVRLAEAIRFVEPLQCAGDARVEIAAELAHSALTKAFECVSKLRSATVLAKFSGSCKLKKRI
jgi:hypothetical protein